MKSRARLFSSLVVTISTVMALSSCGLFPKDSVVSLLNSCGWDSISPATKTSQGWTSIQGDKLVFQGWIANPISKEVPNDIFISILNSKDTIMKDLKGKTGVSRPDLVKGFNEPALANAGYVIGDHPSLAPGEYTLEIRGKFQNQIEICTSTSKLIVK